MRDAAAVERAAIPVERIQGPVLLVSGTDDTLWPGTWMADQVMERLRAHGHPYPFTHLAYPDAGHLVAEMVPGIPATVSDAVHPVRKLRTSFGGTARGTAHGRAAAWPRIVQFLKEHLDA